MPPKEQPHVVSPWFRTGSAAGFRSKRLRKQKRDHEMAMSEPNHLCRNLFYGKS